MCRGLIILRRPQVSLNFINSGLEFHISRVNLHFEIYSLLLGFAAPPDQRERNGSSCLIGHVKAPLS